MSNKKTGGITISVKSKLLENSAMKNDRHALEKLWRIDRANARHVAPDYLPMIASDGEHAAIFPNLENMTEKQLYHFPEMCVNFVLNARYRSTGLELFSSLKNSAKADAAIMHDRTRRADESAKARADYAQARDNAQAFDSISQRVTTLPDIANYAAIQAANERTKRDNFRAYADDIDRADTATTSERAAMVQSAMTKFVEMFSSDNVDVSQIIPNLCKAASDELANLSNPDALTKNSTMTRWLDLEEWKMLEKRYAYNLDIRPYQKIPAANTKSGNNCYRTIEPRERSAEFAKLSKEPEKLAKKAMTADGRAICIIYHYRTAAPYVTFNQFTNSDNAPELATNGGINAIFNQSDNDAIISLFDRAGLSWRERLLVISASNQIAAKHAHIAYSQSMECDKAKIANTPKKYQKQELDRAKKRAEKAAISARWAYAFDRLSRMDETSSYSSATREKYKARICKSLTNAAKAPEKLSAADIAWKNAKKWENMQKNSKRASAPIISSRPNLLSVVEHTADSVPDAVPVIKWMTKAQANNRRAWAMANAEKIAKETKIDNTTPENIAKWKAGQAEYHRRIEEEIAKERERAERERRAQFRPEVYGISTNFQMWQAWTERERAEHMRYLEMLSKA